MGTMQRLRAGWLVVALGLCMVPAGRGHAQVNTERPGSLLIFPKVVNDGTRTTTIQISNTGNSFEQARCFYIDGQRCTDTDFHLTLTKQQPTFWNVGQGRTLRNGLPGINPGPVPPVPPGFVGALVCASVDRSGTPAGTNALTGKATLYGPGFNAAKYNAIAFANTPNGQSGDENIDLDNTEYDACPGAIRVNFPNPQAPDRVIAASGNWGQCVVSGQPCNGDPACVTSTPGTCNTLVTPPYTCATGNVGATCTTDADCTLITNNGPCADGICTDGVTRCTTANPICPQGYSCSALTGSITNVTVLPCNLNLDTLQPTHLALILSGHDGLQNPLSGSKNVSCWESFSLEGTGCSGGVGQACLTQPQTDFATVDIKSTVGGPFVAVAETFHLDTAGNAASAGVNVFAAAGVCAAGDNLGQACNNDDDCVTCTQVNPPPAPLTCVSAGAGSCVATGATIQLPAH